MARKIYSTHRASIELNLITETDYLLLRKQKEKPPDDFLEEQMRYERAFGSYIWAKRKMRENERPIWREHKTIR